jgi:hypothetical protein
MDDETVSLMSFGLEDVRPEEGVAGQVAGALEAEVVSAQRLGIMRNQATYVRGSMPAAGVSAPKFTQEKLFKVTKLYRWLSGQPKELLEDLSQGRVRARVQAAMGTGKSTRLPFMIADGLSCRVLVVALNAHVLRQMSEFVRATGVGKVRRNWSAVQTSRVNVMTYADFCAQMMKASRAELFQSFEVIIFDEAFEATADVFSAKAAFAAYSTAKVSLLLCSATISSDVSAGETTSALSGAFRVHDVALSVHEMVQSGKLLDEHLTDRGYVVLPTDEEVSLVHDHLANAGVESLVLDSAASYADLQDVTVALAGDHVVPRVVVMHYSWAIGLNLPVEYMVLRPFRADWVPVAGRWTEMQFPMTEEYVAQAKSRSGRGLASTSGGSILGVERQGSCELHWSQVQKAFVTMLAMSIMPTRKPMWKECFDVCPEGLPPVAAHTLLKVNLPEFVALKFLAKDGAVASKYARALSMFTQRENYIMPSEHKEPVSLSSWVLDDLVKAKPAIESHRMVPVHADGELQVVLHGIVAFAEGDIELQRWCPDQLPVIGDYDSGTEPKAVATTRLRRIEHVVRSEPQALPSVSTCSDMTYRVEGQLVHPDGRRSARLLDKDRVKEALAELELVLRTNHEPEVSSPVVETASGSVVRLELNTVNSPGGTAVCELPARTCEKMHLGQLLTEAEVYDFFDRIRRVPQPVAGTRMFDGYGGPWLSVLKSLSQPDVMHMVVAKGLWPLAFDFIMFLKWRFDFELVQVMRQSNVTRSLLSRIFTRKPPTAQQLLVMIDRGEFRRMGQSSRFFERVRLINNAHQEVLVEGERRGVFFPESVAYTQRSFRMGDPCLVGAGDVRYTPVQPGLGLVSSVVYDSTWMSERMGSSKRY